MNGTTHGPIYVSLIMHIDGPMGGSIHVDKNDHFCLIKVDMVVGDLWLHVSFRGFLYGVNVNLVWTTLRNETCNSDPRRTRNGHCFEKRYY